MAYDVTMAVIVRQDTNGTKGTRESRWLQVLRWVDGGYFVWRGFHKWFTPAAQWLIPRVTLALPSTPLASIIRRWIFPHAETFGIILGTVEVLAGGLLLVHRRFWLAPLVLFLLNGLFFLTLGFKEPHDMALNLLMGILNLWFFRSAWERKRSLEK